MTLYDGADNATTETEVGPQLVHMYAITNKGPSSITEAEAYFVWPSFTFDGMYLLYPVRQMFLKLNVMKYCLR
jgi:hypothetical protein